MVAGDLKKPCGKLGIAPEFFDPGEGLYENFLGHFLSFFLFSRPTVHMVENPILVGLHQGGKGLGLSLLAPGDPLVLPVIGLWRRWRQNRQSPGRMGPSYCG